VERKKSVATPRSKVPAIVGVVVLLVAGMVIASRFIPSHDPDSASEKVSNAAQAERSSQNVDTASKYTGDAPQPHDEQAQDDATQTTTPAPEGGEQVEALAPDRLKPFVPDSLSGMTRSTVSATRNSAMGMQMTEARATYMNEEGQSLDLQITDTAAAKNLLALAGWAATEGENDTGSGYEKTYQENGRLVHEQWDRSSSRGEYGVVVADRFAVKVEGQAESIDDLKAALADVDLDALEALEGEGAAKKN
jgi:cytoskeletal protein RodZ